MTISYHKILFACFAFLMAAAHVARVHADGSPANPFETYKTHRTQTVTITYPSGEQAFVDEILLGYEFPLRILDDTAFDAQLARWKKHDLSLIANKLALDKPTDGMDAAFEQFSAWCKPAVSEEIREIRIYYFSDIKAAHERGIPLEGIGYVAQTDSVSISNHITADGPSGQKVRVIPIILMQKIEGMADEKMRLFNGTVRDMRWRLDEAVYNAYCAKLYEMTRPAIIAAIDKARFPLWVIDGMTNAIPLVVMRSHNPGLTFEQILRTHSNPPPELAAIAARINPETWLSTRTAATPKAESDAYSYLAMLAVIGAIDQNGEEWIPELFKRLREENTPALNIVTIYGIYGEITGGKDLRENLAGVKTRLAKN